MIAYFDTSALVPLLIEEPSSEACRDLWNAVDQRMSARVSRVEAAAALSSAERAGRISAVEHDSALDELDEFFAGLNIVELDERLVRIAAGLTRSHALRGYDAVQCAAAVISASDELVAVSGDTHLLAAWSALGVATADTNPH